MLCPPAAAQEQVHPGDHRMTLDHNGTVMNANDSTLPRDCTAISRDYSFQVYAGTEFSQEVPGSVFGFSRNEFVVEPCSRISVTFTNKDEVRHQWMLHGLPRYLYPGGMFHLEAAGGQSKTGTFIVPSDDATYLVHCDIAQHMEKGMKAQLKVGAGSGDLWSIPGISGGFRRDNYLPDNARAMLVFVMLAGFFVVLLVLLGWKRNA